MCHTLKGEMEIENREMGNEKMEMKVGTFGAMVTVTLTMTLPAMALWTSPTSFLLFVFFPDFLIPLSTPNLPDTPQSISLLAFLEDQLHFGPETSSLVPEL